MVEGTTWREVVVALLGVGGFPEYYNAQVLTLALFSPIIELTPTVKYDPTLAEHDLRPNLRYGLDNKCLSDGKWR